MFSVLSLRLSVSFTMSFVGFLSTFILYLGVLSEGHVVNVGAIFSFNTIIGRVSRIAMEAAKTDVNSHPSFLGGTKLDITMHDANYSEFLGLMGALQFMETDTVAIIGPQDASMAHVLSHIANALHVPFLSFTALDPSLSSLQYPYFVQTAPNDLFLMTAIADMISYYGWRDVTVIFSDDDSNRNGIAALGDKLAERRCKISYKATLPPASSATPSQIRDQLVEVQRMESRVIVVNTCTETGLIIFEIAQELGMMKDGYIWIATAWLSTALDSTPSQATNSTLGAITLQPHT